MEGLSKVYRKFHRFAAWISFIPLLFIITTGLLLQLKVWIPWIQPPIEKGSSTIPRVDFNVILKAGRSVPAARVQEWKDIRAVDVRPSNGVANIRTRSGYEVSVDLGTGAVIHAAPRRTDFLIGLHEGSFFGQSVRYGVFLPVATLLLVLGGLAFIFSFGYG